jgi:hypothetical protein
MQLSVDIEGPSSVAETAELRAWLRDSRIGGVEAVRQEEAPPKPATLLGILTVVLASRALVELVRSIHRYIEARTPKTKIKLKAGNKLIEIDCTNPPPLSQLVEQARALAAD